MFSPFPSCKSLTDKTIEFQTLDIATTVGVGTTSERLYLKDQTNPSVKPENVLDGYRIGAGSSDRLNVLLPISAGITSEFSSRIVSLTPNQVVKKHLMSIGVLQVLIVLVVVVLVELQMFLL